MKPEAVWVSAEDAARPRALNDCSRRYLLSSKINAYDRRMPVARDGKL